MKSKFYKKDGIEYLSKGNSFYGGELHLEKDIKVDNLDFILDLIDDYVDVVESLEEINNPSYKGDTHTENNN